MPTNKSSDIRDRLLQAAIGILRQSGPLALTQPRVARRARVAQGHLTYYFPTRRALLTAVAESVSESLLAEFDAVAKAAGESKAGRIPTSGANAGERTRMLLSFVLAADEEPAIRDMFRALTRTIRTKLSAGLIAAQLPGDDATVALIHALCVGLAVLELARDEPTATAEMGSALAAAFAALRQPPPAKPARRKKTTRRPK